MNLKICYLIKLKKMISKISKDDDKDLNDDYEVLKENPSVPVAARVLSIESVRRSSSICVTIVGKSQF